jgi:M6 family metalloprotease-like protein
VSRYLVATITLGTSIAAAVAFPKLPAPTGKPPSPELADYKGADQAVTAKIEPSASSGASTGYLGVTVERDKSGRPVVDLVQPKSPAEQAGMQKGDIFVRVADHTITTAESFREWVQGSTPGKPIKIDLLREGKPVEVTVKLDPTSRPLKPPTGPRPYLGLEVEEVKEGDGVKVKSVASGSPAEKAKLEVGDLLLKLDGDEFNRPNRLQDHLGDKKPGDHITFLVIGAKDKKEKELVATLGTPEARKGGFGPGGGGGGRFGGGGPAVAPSLWKSPMLKLAIVGIEFADTKHNSKDTPDELEKLFLSRDSYKQTATGQTAVGSLHDYLNEVSSGALKLEKGKAFPWVELTKKRGDYVQGSGTSNRIAPLVDTLNKMTSGDAKDALKDFDAIVFIYAGDRFAQNRGAVFYPHAGTILHQQRRIPYMLIPEGTSRLTQLSGLAKEAELMLGLPDLTARREIVGSVGLGPWCALSIPDTDRPARPPHLSAWAKEKLGWIEPRAIDPTVKQKLILSPIENSKKECFKVLVRPDGSEYFLLENRKKTGFDADLPGEGLLIWRVVNDRPILEPSHGVDGPNAPNVHLSAIPYPSAANNAFTPNTIPSSRSPQGGGLPVNITSIKRHPDGRVSFRIGYEYD